MRCSAELDVGHEVPKIRAEDLSPLTFHRDYVSRNKPVIITGSPLGDACARELVLKSWKL